MPEKICNDVIEKRLKSNKDTYKRSQNSQYNTLKLAWVKIVVMISYE
jgi:hypothetical protein